MNSFTFSKSFIFIFMFMTCLVNNVFSDDELSWFQSDIKKESRETNDSADLISKTVESQSSEFYQINAGDILEINVWREPDLNKDVMVRPDGAISVPLLGEINVRNKTISDLQKLITSEYEKYIPEPVVTVSTKSIMGNKVFVVGNVNRPGEIVMNQQIDVMQALGIAGGISTFADVNAIKILRRENNGQMIIPFRYGDIERGENLEQNIVLLSGDVLIVP